MIFDNIHNSELYYGIHPKCKAAFEFIQKAVENNLEKGKYEIDGEEIYAVVQQYETKLQENAVFEGHKKYIDVQYVVEGLEMLGLQKISKAVVKNEYDEGKDAALYERSADASYCVATKGDFCIFYPHDLHSPGVAYNNLPTPVKKIVVKIRI